MLDVKKTEIEGVLILTPKRWTDARGFFVETWNAERFRQAGIAQDFVQDNHSYSAEPGTVRALHYQSPPRAQAKLVRVMRGAVIDVAVDVRKGSSTYGKHVRALLSAENGAQLFVPAGFLHGFATLEPHTDVAYKVTDYYSQPNDGGVLWNDPDLAIDWGVDPLRAVLSDKDAKAPRFADFKSPF
jgi:dTDP-4-dehydrorhamnose 3,5-epimerase